MKAIKIFIAALVVAMVGLLAYPQETKADNSDTKVAIISFQGDTTLCPPCPKCTAEQEAAKQQQVTAPPATKKQNRKQNTGTSVPDQSRSTKPEKWSNVPAPKAPGTTINNNNEINIIAGEDTVRMIYPPVSTPPEAGQICTLPWWLWLILGSLLLLSLILLILLIRRREQPTTQGRNGGGNSRSRNSQSGRGRARNTQSGRNAGTGGNAGGTGTSTNTQTGGNAGGTGTSPKVVNNFYIN